MIAFWIYYLPMIIGIIASVFVGGKMIRRQDGHALPNLVLLFVFSITPFINLIWAGCCIVAYLHDLKEQK